MLKTVGSFLADAVPILGTVKGVQEVFTGTDYVTGQELSVGDRVATGVGTLISFVPGGKVVGKTATKGAIDGGNWLVEKLIKEKSSYAKPSELFIAGSGSIMGQQIKPKNIYRELRKTSIGKETIDIIQKNNVEVNLSYTEPFEDIYGEAFGNTAIAYIKNTQSLNLTAQIIIHEVTHAGLKIKGTQRAEIIAFMRGSKHNYNELSVKQIREIIEMVKATYPELPYR